jgi:hypothetical protein
VRGQPVRLEHVVERVEERPQVGVDLLQQRSRQEAEPFAGLHGRAGQDDPPDLSVRESRDSERHSQIRLARARRADPEGDRVAADRVDVALLRDRLRRDLLATMAPDDVVEDLADVLGLLKRGHDRIDGRRADLVAALDEVGEFVDDGSRLLDAWLVALDREPVAAQHDRAAEPFPKGAEHAVADRRELGRDLV